MCIVVYLLPGELKLTLVNFRVCDCYFIIARYRFRVRGTVRDFVVLVVISVNPNNSVTRQPLATRSDSVN